MFQNRVLHQPNLGTNDIEVDVRPAQVFEAPPEAGETQGYWTVIHPQDADGELLAPFWIHSNSREIMDIHPDAYYDGIQERKIKRALTDPKFIFSDLLPAPGFPDRFGLVPCFACKIPFEPPRRGSRCAECRHWICDNCFNKHASGRTAFPICGACNWRERSAEIRNRQFTLDTLEAFR